MTQITLTQFNQALTANQGAPINEPAFQALQGKIGPGLLAKLLSDVQAQNDSAVNALMRYGSIAGLFARLGGLGLEARIENARAILENHPIEDVRAVVANALNGDANAKRVLVEWVNETRSDGGTAAGNFPSLPPPRSASAAPAQNVTHLRPPCNGEIPSRTYQRPPTQPVTRVQQPQAGPGDAPMESRQLAPRVYDQAKAHGGRAALTFQADTTQGGDPTVMIEAAPMLNREDRTYNWKEKTRFQLTRHELQLVTALLFEMIPDLHFSNHNEKWMHITRQDADPKYGGTIKFTIGVGKAAQNQPLTVQVDSSSLGEIAALFVRQTCAQLKCDVSILSPVLRQVAKAYLTQQACRAGGNAQPQRAAG